MRYFNDTEKEVIDYICDAESTSEESSIKKLFEKKCDCSMQWHNDILTIYVEDPSSHKHSITQILNIICLFEYLKSEGLIYLFRNVRDSYCMINKEHGHIALDKEWDFIETEVDEIIPGINTKYNGKVAQVALNPYHLSKDISNKIFYFFNCSFFCSETLRHIKGQDYKDDATIQYENNRRQAKKAIRISLVVGIGSILLGAFVGLVSYLQNERHHQESMTQTQKIVIVHDTIIPSDQPSLRTMNNMFPKPINDSLKSTKTKSK